MRHFAKKGFTIVELIIVIAVIGVLAAILIPVFSNVIEKANAKSALSDARNTVSQVIIEASDNESIPENIVIAVKKANKFYLYGYNRIEGGQIKISTGNPYNVATFDELYDNYSWNAKNTTPPATDTTYDPTQLNQSFYLVIDGDNSAIKGRAATKAVPAGATNVTDMLPNSMGKDGDIVAYHGILLPGTFTTDTDAATSGGMTGGVVDPGGNQGSGNEGEIPGTTPAPGTTTAPGTTDAPITTDDPNAPVVPDPSKQYQIKAKVYDTWNDVTTDIIISSDTLAIDVAGNDFALAVEKNAQYFVAASAGTFTATAQGSDYVISETINGTRLAKYNSTDGTYARFATTGAYASGDSACYQVVITEKGLENFRTRYDGRYLLNNDEALVVSEPLDAPKAQFTGVFDGNGKSIKMNDYSNTAASSASGGINVGLFRENYGTIRNVNLTAGNITAYAQVGAFVGYNNPNAKIINCHATATSVKATDASSSGAPVYIGGFTGKNAGGTIEGCSFTGGTIYTPSNSRVYGGGFCGSITDSGTITDCHARSIKINTQNVNSYYVGGFIGTILSGTTVSWSSATGTDIYASEYAGGFAGSCEGTIQYSYSEFNTLYIYSDSVQAGAYSGAFCGTINGGVVSNSYARIDDIYGGFFVSGFATIRNANISNCYLQLTNQLSFAGSDWCISVYERCFYYCSCSLTDFYYTANDTNWTGAPGTCAVTDADLITAAKANTSWINAGCWDFSGPYVKLISYEEFSAK